MDSQFDPSFLMFDQTDCFPVLPFPVFLFLHIWAKRYKSPHTLSTGVTLYNVYPCQSAAHTPHLITTIQTTATSPLGLLKPFWQLLRSLPTFPRRSHRHSKSLNTFLVCVLLSVSSSKPNLRLVCPNKHSE